MKSTICHLDSDNLDLRASLLEVERCARYEALSAKETLRLRLLAEEALGMLKSILTRFEADFWVEAQNKDFELHITAASLVTDEQRKSLLSVSNTGENIATRGIMGKVRNAFEHVLYGGDDGYLAASAMTMGTMGDMEPLAFAQAWSLMNYRSTIEAEEDGKEDWDELEKSIIANLADDVLVGVRSQKAEIIVKKQF